MSKAMFTKAGVVTLNQVNTYNGNGQRVEKSENGQSTKYYYQNDSVLYTTGNDDKSTELEEPDNTEIMTGVTSLNLMGASENVIATVRNISSSEGEKYYFYNKDMRESTTNVVGVEGKSEVAYEYTDFGETEIKGDENFFNEICYTGGIYDKKIGLYYLNARYYNPEDGRFLTEDTYRGDSSDPSSLHLYAYCVNNPIAYKDPSGHIPVWGVINAGFGAIDGYNYAKKKNLKGIKKVGAIVGGAVLGTIDPFKKVKVAKSAKKVKKIAKKRKSTKVVAKRVKKATKKASKSKTSSKKLSKKVSKAPKKKKTKKSSKASRNKKDLEGGVCFTAGTLISTKDGLIPIEDIEEGKLVWSQNPETGEIALKKVVQTFTNEADTILKIKVDGEVIEATEQHVFYINNVGWIPANMIEEGDTVVLQSGEKVTVDEIDKVVYDELITVYNFEVEDFHTYFVSNTRILVHNSCYVDENRTPIDSETILNNSSYNRTSYEVKGAKVYKKGKYYYHRDTLHKGKSAHLEVYSKRGKHLGEADPKTGKLKPGTADPKKTIKL
ncbi:MAG: polymorphic toxin-type HINT domain-containing protein [Terrisporobacter sp.]